MTTRMNTINDIRAILDFLELHEEFPLPVAFKPSRGQFTAWCLEPDPEAAKAWVADRARELRTCEKVAQNGFLGVFRPFGDVSLGVKVSQEATCEKRVVGTHEVEKPIYREAVTYERVTEEIVEWVCPDSLLRGTRRP